MGYKFYELLLLFAMYSILGWVVEQIIYSTTGKIVKRGLVKGPVGLIYGFGGLLIVEIMGPFQDNVVYLLFGSILICIFLELIVLIMIHLVSGVSLWKYYFIFPLMGGLFSMVLIFDINPLIMKLIDYMPLWIHFVFLIIFYVLLVADFIDAVDLLRLYRKGIGKLKNAEVDNIEYGEMVCDFLEPYSRWIKGYPHFRKVTMKKVLKDYNPEEIEIIKKAMKHHLQ